MVSSFLFLPPALVLFLLFLSLCSSLCPWRTTYGAVLFVKIKGYLFAPPPSQDDTLMYKHTFVCGASINNPTNLTAFQMPNCWHVCNFQSTSPFCHNPKALFIWGITPSLVSSLLKNLDDLQPNPHVWREGKRNWSNHCSQWTSLLCGFHGVNPHQLCSTNSINPSSEKSIECITAHISQ